MLYQPPAVFTNRCCKLVSDEPLSGANSLMIRERLRTSLPLVRWFTSSRWFTKGVREKPKGVYSALSMPDLKKGKKGGREKRRGVATFATETLGIGGWGKSVNLLKKHQKDNFSMQGPALARAHCTV
jgi:hypothetical protein